MTAHDTTRSRGKEGTDTNETPIGSDDAATSPSMGVTTYHTADDETLGEAVVRAVAAETDTAQPLYDAIDLEALDNLFSDRPMGWVTFHHAGVELAVTSGGEIRIIEAGDDGAT